MLGVEYSIGFFLLVDHLKIPLCGHSLRQSVLLGHRMTSSEFVVYVCVKYAVASYLCRVSCLGAYVLLMVADVLGRPCFGISDIII